MNQRVLFPVFLLSSICLPWPSSAQVAGQTIDGCGYARAIFSQPGQFEVAAVLSLLRQNEVYIAADDNTIGPLRECAAGIRKQVCRDGLLLGMLDPVGSLCGGVGGMAVDMMKGGPSILGGLVGAGVVGSTVGIVKMGMCEKDLKEVVEPAAASAFQGWRVDFQSVRDDATRGRIREAATNGRITQEQAGRLDKYVTGVAAVLSGQDTSGPPGLADCVGG
jgi:hypothetical protein